jgi:FkbM family methyltransferase
LTTVESVGYLRLSPAEAIAEVGRCFAGARVRPQFPDAGTSVTVYGAGNRGQEIRRVLERHGHRVEAFLDQVLGGENALVNGLPCYAPDDRRPLRMHRSGMDLVLGIYRHDLDLGEIASLLRRRGYDRIWTLYDLFQRFGSEFSAPFWLSDARLPEENESGILRALSLLEDDRSRGVFIEALRLRTSGDLEFLRRPDRRHQYFPPDLVPPSSGLRMIDGGAFTGDTFRAFRGAGFTFQALAAFEPDPVNFAALASFFWSVSDRPAELSLFPCGLWSETKQLRLSSGGEGSRVEDRGDSAIQGVAMDDVLVDFRPNFLKLDVEGAEPMALAGGSRLIETSRPLLAVSCYHTPEHLWEVPQMIADWGLGYHLHLRYHSFNGFDLVIYAIPR